MGQPFPPNHHEPARPDKDIPSTGVRRSGRQPRPASANRTLPSRKRRLLRPVPRPRPLWRKCAGRFQSRQPGPRGMAPSIQGVGARPCQKSVQQPSRDAGVSAGNPKVRASVCIYERQRQYADYDPGVRFSREEVMQLIQETEETIAGLDSISARDRRSFAVHVLLRHRRD